MSVTAAPGHAEAATAGILAASAAIHDEAGATARGVGQTIPGNDEATLVARGVDPAIATAIGSGDATTARDLATPAAPRRDRRSTCRRSTQVRLPSWAGWRGRDC